MTTFERITAYLRDEGYPKTPQEISIWTGIPLSNVYEILQTNRMFFREIIKNESLVGWTIDML